jgi:hypothetical protein
LGVTGGGTITETVTSTAETFHIYLPDPLDLVQVASGLRPGDGLVGTAVDAAAVRVFKAPADPTLVNWADRVHRAAMRARLQPMPDNIVPTREVLAVGRYSYREGLVTLFDEHIESVCRWLDLNPSCRPVPGYGLLSELESTRPVHQERRRLRSMLAAGRLPRHAIEFAVRRAGHEDLLAEGWETFVDDWDWQPAASGPATSAPAGEPELVLF